LALAEERPALVDQDGIDREIEHVDQALVAGFKSESQPEAI